MSEKTFAVSMKGPQRFAVAFRSFEQVQDGTEIEWIEVHVRTFKGREAASQCAKEKLKPLPGIVFVGTN